jgi:hypothetical protein
MTNPSRIDDGKYKELKMAEEVSVCVNEFGNIAILSGSEDLQVGLVGVLDAVSAMEFAESVVEAVAEAAEIRKSRIHDEVGRMCGREMIESYNKLKERLSSVNALKEDGSVKDGVLENLLPKNYDCKNGVECECFSGDAEKVDGRQG